jgi:heme-degrading monooxygenase HmoA
MYVTVRRYTLAGSGEELVRRIKTEFVPIVTALPGFKAYHVVDCGGREAMSISFWDNKVTAGRGAEAAREWISKSALAWSHSHLRGCKATPFSILLHRNV